MDTAHKADAAPIVIRSAEPEDAARIAALLGQPGVYEGLPDKWGGVLRIELHVHADNDRAMALYCSLGFVEEGRHPAFSLKNGRYVDSFSMARLHPNPAQLPSRT